MTAVRRNQAAADAAAAATIWRDARGRADRVHALACAAAALVGICFTVACFHPGYLSIDSIDQLRQARSGRFNGWHPPVMAWLWGHVDRLVPGAVGMLVLHNAAFWTGLALCAHRCVRRPAWAAATVLLIGLSPAVLALLSTIWKDVGMGAALCLAFALLLRADERRSRAALIASLPLLFYACAVRSNAALAVLPLALWAGGIAARLVPRTPRDVRAGAAAGLAAFVALVGLAGLANSRLARGAPPYSYQPLLLHDLAGIAAAGHAVAIPAYISAAHPGFTADDLGRLYSPDGCLSLVDGPSAIPETWVDANIADLTRSWRQALLDHPLAYLRHRLRFSAALLGMQAEVCFPFHPGMTSNAMVDFPPRPLNDLVMRPLQALRDSLFFRTWIYLLATVVLTVVAWRRHLPRRSAALALGVSGILYLLPSLLIAPSCDFRYSWWTVLTALLLLPLTLGQRRRSL